MCLQLRKPAILWVATMQCDQQIREVVVPSCSILVRPSERTWSCWSRFRGGHRDVRGLEHLSYGNRLRELGFFSLHRRRLQGCLIVALQYLKTTASLSEATKRAGATCFISAVCLGWLEGLKELPFQQQVAQSFTSWGKTALEFGAHVSSLRSWSCCVLEEGWQDLKISEESGGEDVVCEVDTKAHLHLCCPPGAGGEVSGKLASKHSGLQ